MEEGDGGCRGGGDKRNKYDACVLAARFHCLRDH